MEQFIMIVSLICGFEAEHYDEKKSEQCMLYYVNCAIEKGDEYDLDRLKKCADKQGHDYKSAEEYLKSATKLD